MDREELLHTANYTKAVADAHTFFNNILLTTMFRSYLESLPTKEDRKVMVESLIDAWKSVFIENVDTQVNSFKELYGDVEIADIETDEEKEAFYDGLIQTQKMAMEEAEMSIRVSLNKLI